MFRPALRALVLLLVGLIVAREADSRDARDFSKRHFNAGSDAGFNPIDKGHSALKVEYNDCKSGETEVVDHGSIRCVFSGCRLQCERGYTTSAGSHLYLSCNHQTGVLQYNNGPWRLSAPPCKPSCGRRRCQNGGECVAPNVCQCSPGFSGRNCEVALATCQEPQFSLMMATASVKNNQLNIECLPGFVLPKGGKHVTVQCKDGDWLFPSGLISHDGIECVGECNPPCQNGGVCIIDGVCDCPQSYWGDLCEHHYCSAPRPEPSHSTRIGTLASQKILCDPGYKMISGKASETIICVNSAWEIPGKGPFLQYDVNCYPE